MGSRDICRKKHIRCRRDVDSLPQLPQILPYGQDGCGSVCRLSIHKTRSQIISQQNPHVNSKPQIKATKNFLRKESLTTKRGIKKAKKRGAFKERIFLEKVIQNGD